MANITTKRLCLERDGFHCRHCGDSEDIKATVIDNKAFNKAHLSNLISLCPACIREKHLAESTPASDKVGIILAGGRGTRLMPLTRFFNKHELPISLTPMIFYPLKTLRSFGIKRCLVVIDRENTNTLVNMLGSGKEFGMDISYKVQEGAGGIANALKLADDFVKPNDQIYCILGDNIFDNSELDHDISIDKHEACVYVKTVSNPQDYGVADFDGEHITKIIEKPTEFVSDKAVVGLYVYGSRSVFSVIDGIKPSNRGELEISTVNDWYADSGQLKYKMVNGYWNDAGSSVQKYAESGLFGVKRAKVTEKEVTDFVSDVFGGK